MGFARCNRCVALGLLGIGTAKRLRAISDRGSVPPSRCHDPKAMNVPGF